MTALELKEALEDVPDDIEAVVYHKDLGFVTIDEAFHSCCIVTPNDAFPHRSTYQEIYDVSMEGYKDAFFIN